MTWAFTGETANYLLTDGIRAQIISYVEDSLPTSQKLTPVKNGTDYCRRLRCIQWAYDLADAAQLLELPWSESNPPIKEIIKSAQLFLSFQKEEHFRLLSLVEGGECLRDDSEERLRQMMEEEEVEE
jgi:hypothetical protein